MAKIWPTQSVVTHGYPYGYTCRVSPGTFVERLLPLGMGLAHQAEMVDAFSMWGPSSQSPALHFA